MTASSRVRSVAARLLRLTDRLSFLAPLLLRVTLGLVFIRSGWGKLHNLNDTTDFFASLHIPLPGLNARLAAGTEVVGGILLLPGLLTRLAALPMAFTMVVAIGTAKLGDVHSVLDFADLNEWAYLVMFLTLVLLGPGRLSLDAWLARKLGLPGLSAHRNPSGTL